MSISSDRCFLIAEAGVNHGGSLNEAIKLAEAAKNAGADAVKYQCFDSMRLWGDDRISELELTYAEFLALHQNCEDIGIEFMCTPFGVEETEFLKPLVKRMKIASGCSGRFDLLAAVRETGLPVILSTGMTDLYEIGLALGQLRASDITLLQCTSSYPCRLEDVNLRGMDALRLAFNLPVGFSDHTNGITVAIAAAAKGAVVIEKHLTLDRNQEGPDHKASITPREFKALHMAIIEVEAALGSGKKEIMRCERDIRALWRGN